MIQPPFSLDAQLLVHGDTYEIEDLLESSMLGFFVIRFPNTFTISVRERSQEDFVSIQSSDYDDLLYQIHPDDRARVDTRFKNAQNNPVVSTILFRLLPHGSEEILWLRAHFHGVQTGEILGLLEDVSQLKYQGYAYQSVQKRMNTAIDSARMGAWEWFADGNRVFLYGFLFDELGLRSPKKPFDLALVQEWVHPMDLDGVRKKTLAFIKHPQRAFQLEFRLRGKDSAWIWVRLVGKVILHKDDKPSRMNGILQDISAEKSKEYLRTMLKIERVGYFEIYPDRDHSLHLDQSAVQMLDLNTSHPTVGSMIRKIKSPRAELTFENLMERTKHTTDTLFSHQFVLDLPQGQRWIQMECISRRSHAGEAYLEGFLIDQTEKRIQDRRIRENQKLFDRITQHSPIGILLLNEAGYIQYINEDGSRRMGYTRMGMLHRHLTEFVHPELLPKLFYLLDKIHKTKPTGHKERMLFVTQSGDRIWMDLTISHIDHQEDNPEVLFLMEDITEKINNQQSILQLEEKYLFLFQAAPVALGIFNFNSEAIIINDAYTELLGYSKAELIGKPFDQLTIPEEREAFRKLYQDLFEGEAQQVITDKHYIHKDGHSILVKVNLKRADDGLNEPLVIATIQSIG
jgi:PAS domain S-box-containing protein